VNSRIFVGYLMHAREAPISHAFRYPLYVYGIDLDELSSLPGWFGYNRWRPVSLFDEDYGPRRSGSIREKVLELLAEHGVDDVARIVLVTGARYFGRVFNPVSFYFCWRKDGARRCVVAEVNNTFGERHFYVLDTTSRMVLPRAFHVSPFNDLRGEYQFHFAPLEDGLDARIDILRDGQLVFRSQLFGAPRSLTTASLARTLVEYPLTAWLTLPRILWQAAVLHFRHRLPAYSTPAPSHQSTVRTSAPSLLERFRMELVLRALDRVRGGSIKVTLPDATERVLGDGEPRCEWRVGRYATFARMLVDTDIGMGDGFEAGEWTSPDVVALMRLLAENEDRFSAPWILRMIYGLRHRAPRNDRAGSRANIRAHYDTGNDFFRLFLDESMTYSCALFPSDEATLEDAQQAKIQAILSKSDVRAGDSILEIGCGWGAFAVEAARRTDCRVTAITLSRAQWEVAAARVREAGLAPRVDVQLCDYRDVGGVFDRIVSIEMLEAVGHQYYGTFFSTCAARLAPDGRLVLQTITLPNARYASSSTYVDWIKKRIFPGGCLPSVEAIEAAARPSGLRMLGVEAMGPHYARTLRAWRERLHARREEAHRLGCDDAFVRRWDYYLALCEAIFLARRADVVQIVLSR